MATDLGILNVDKPRGITSRGVVDHVERLCRPAKAGHAGTLDPLATGVLVVCVGQATRLIRYVQQMPKSYRGTFLLGRRSESDDVEGPVEVLANVSEPTRVALDRAIPQFVGRIEQRPPAFSAVKIAGRPAYALARKGKAVELAPRPVTIHRLAVTRYEYPELELDIECGSGTYVRSLGRDLAAALGTSAVMSALVRTRIGAFRIEEAASLDELTPDTWRQHLQPPLAAVTGLPRIELGEAQLVEIRHGRPIARPADGADGPEWAAIDMAGQLSAILYEKLPGQLWPAMNFA